MIRYSFYVALCVLSFLAGETQAQDIAVIVNKENPAKLTREDIKAIFKGNKLSWKSKTPIVLGILEGQVEDAFNDSVLGIKTSKVKKLWLKIVFQGNTDAPRTFSSADELKKFVGGNKWAIGYLKEADVDTSLVKVVGVP